MPKINQEEYEVLKTLGSRWKWIARDRDDSLYAFEKKPYKHIRTWLWRGNHDFRIIIEAGFQFIQWEDEEPHNIAELIEEYERYEIENIHVERKHPMFNCNRFNEFYNANIAIWDRLEESEETEVKKNLEWLLDYVEAEYDKAEEKEEDHPLDLYYTGKREALREVFGKIKQLDEPEVLSDKWIDDNKVARINNLRKMTMDDVVPVDKLQNLLVPKQELPVIPNFVADWVEEVKPDNSLRVAFEYIAQRKRDNYDDELAFWVEEGNSETFARAWLDGYEVAEEQKYIISINITDKDSKTNYETFLNKRGIFHSMENDSFNSEEFNWSEEEIKDLENGEILFEHFAVKIEELEE